MEIIYKTGNILEAPENYISQGCNAQGKMGSGLAKAIYERYPEVREAYLASYRLHRKLDLPFLGTIHHCHTDRHVVINMITQEFYGYDGKLYASYEAIESCFKLLDEEAKRRNSEPNDIMPNMEAVAIPLIGCGLAGGDWNIVSEIIERNSTAYQPIVYKLN